MSKREADFSQKTKMTIAYRCRHKCSNPSCRYSTMKEDSRGELYSIGRACHIEAASKGGARYNASSTLEERKDVSNAIWLCPICADMIDKDVETYPTKLLKEWKMVAEKTNSDGRIHIIAVANQAGGVGNSSVAAYLTQATALLTGEKVLCISASAFDNAGTIMFGKRFEIDKEHIIKTNYPFVEYLGDKAISKIYRNDIEMFGKLNLDRLVKEKQYKYIFVDCGKGMADEKFALFHMATDIIIPVGEHWNTNTGIERVGEWLRQRPDKVKVWPLYSMGLTFSNKLYRRIWYQKVWKEINKIAENKKVIIKIPSIIIPKSRYVGMVLDIWNNKKTKHVAEAYMDLANELVNYELNFCDELSNFG